MIATITYFWSASELFSRVSEFFNRDHQFGRFHGSIATLFSGIVILSLAIFVSRLFSKIIQHRIAARAHLGPGVSYTVARLTHYIILALGVLFALNQGVGLDLTSLAVIFTALSLGIGFGLQYIASDIASGFILLFERPIRVGDRVTIDKDEGDVRSINLRTTIVETNDRIAVIIPNSKLVRDRVINWSYGDPRARIPIPVGVAYGSDVQLVTDTLLLAAEGVENVLQNPAPAVQFLKFGESSLDFRLLVWSSQPRRHTQIVSDINYRIDQLFRERKIEIPFPTTELRWRREPSQTASDDLPSEEDAGKD